jgi:hypothetical protein
MGEEARGAIATFNALTAPQQQQLITFLKSLSRMAWRIAREATKEWVLDCFKTVAGK